MAWFTTWMVPFAELAAIGLSAVAGIYALKHDFKDADGRITKEGRRGILFIVFAGVLSVVIQIGKQVDQRGKERAAAMAAAEAAKAAVEDSRRMASLVEEVLALQRFIDFARIQLMQIPLLDRWTEASGMRVTVRFTFVSNADGDDWLLLGETHVPLEWTRRSTFRPDSALIIINGLDLRIVPPDDHDGRPATIADLVESVASMEVSLQPTVRDPLGGTVALVRGWHYPEGLPRPVIIDFGRGRGVLLSSWSGGPERWESLPRSFP